MTHSQDTLYIISDQKIADLKYHEEINLPHEEYSVYINDEKKELYIRPYLSVNLSDDKTTRLEVKKRSAGRTEIEALKNPASGSIIHSETEKIIISNQPGSRVVGSG